MRRGSDALKAAAPDSRGVPLERASPYGPGAFGCAGIDVVLALLIGEIAISLHLLVLAPLADLGPACVQCHGTGAPTLPISSA